MQWVRFMFGSPLGSMDVDWLVLAGAGTTGSPATPGGETPAARGTGTPTTPGSGTPGTRSLTPGGPSGPGQ